MGSVAPLRELLLSGRQECILQRLTGSAHFARRLRFLSLLNTIRTD